MLTENAQSTKLVNLALNLTPIHNTARVHVAHRHVWGPGTWLAGHDINNGKVRDAILPHMDTTLSILGVNCVLAAATNSPVPSMKWIRLY
jgi:hypothetical protein